MCNHLSKHTRTAYLALARLSEPYRHIHRAAKWGHAPNSDRPHALGNHKPTTLTTESSTSEDVDELALDEEQDDVAVTLASSHEALSRRRTLSSPTSYASIGSYRNVRFVSLRGHPPPCSICLLQELVHCTTLKPAIRPTILQEREKIYPNLKDTYTEIVSSQITYNGARSLQESCGYRTPRGTKPIPLAIPPL